MRRTDFGDGFMTSAGLLFLYIAAVTPAAGEVHTITASGEYRLTATDTPEEATRRALEEAIRLALDRTWTYLLDVSELKPFRLSRNDMREFTQGLIEITERGSERRREGDSVVIRADVAAKVDTVLVHRRINAARQSQNVGD